MRDFSLLPLSLIVALCSLSITKSEVDDCSLYLGESTIKNAGWGVFAGRSFKAGDHVGPPGIGIPVLDPERILDDGPIHKYLWRSWITGGKNEADRVRTFLPGVGSLANYHPFKFNVIEGGFNYAPLFDRNREPHSGANSAYHNFMFIATVDINAGDEIFIGEAELEKEYPEYPSKSDYQRAIMIVDNLIDYHHRHPELSQTQWIDILYRIKVEIADENDKSINLLPDTIEQLLDIERSGLSFVGLINRNFDDIRKAGLCLDAIREGPSTIPEAGRGAFSTKSISKGSIISPVPLLQIMNANALRSLHNIESNSSQQLLVNYCFGHEHSEMLLCPLSLAALVNHKSGGANAEVRWGRPSTNRADDVNVLLERPGSLRVDHADFVDLCSKLSLELIATKDLLPGEEILIDYGSSWENTMADYVKNWIPVNDGFVPASIKNKEEWAIFPDSSLIYECRLVPMADKLRSWTVEEEEDYHAIINEADFMWSDKLKVLFGKNPNVAWFPCDVVGFDKQGLYRAKVYSKSLDVVKVIMNIHSIPRNAIRFVDEPYHSDQHISRSFRHFIPMPENIFPSRWRDDYLTAMDFRLGDIDKGEDGKDTDNEHLLLEHEQRLREAKCGLYFAPSNIPEAGFSSYTAVPYLARGVPIGTAMSAIVIPYTNQDKDFQWDIHNYVWNSLSYNAEFERNAEADVLGVSLANFHPGLVNVKVKSAKFEPVLDSCKDPGAGAFSDYVGSAFLSGQVLKQGEELFISYGELWFTSRQEFNALPLSKNYVDANRVVASVMSFMEVSGFDSDSTAASDLLDLVKVSIVNERRTSVILSKIETPTHMKEVITRNGTAQSSVVLRSQAWFEEHGQCMDHVYCNQSTIPQAGKGAFSRRALKIGSTIISTPLILTWGQGNLRLKGDIDSEKINSRLLLENYQFKHPSVDVYFLPITQVTAINHGSHRKGSSNPPNAKIEWAKWNQKSNYYLQKPIEDLRNEHYSTMVFDVVATRDISVDEEILIDYGEEWEKAWTNHVKNFASPCQGRNKQMHSSLAVHSMNLDKFNSSFHDWSTDHFTVCQERSELEGNINQWIYLAKKSTNASINGELLVIDNSFKGIQWDDEGFSLIQETGRIPCKIISSSPEADEFDVVFFRPSTTHLEGIVEAQRLQLYIGFPANAIDFIHKPFRSDMHRPGTFRHPIAIPDNIFPAHWRS